MAHQVISRSFFRIDLAAKLLGFRAHAPVNVLADEQHVLIVGASVLVEDPDLTTDVLEYFAVQGRLANCESGGVETVSFVVAESCLAVRGRVRVDRTAR